MLFLSTVALTKEEIGVTGRPRNAIMQTSEALLPISKYSLAEIFSIVNPKDKNILKYIPDGFLSEKQILAKYDAVRNEKINIEKYRNKQLKAQKSLPVGDATRSDSAEKAEMEQGTEPAERSALEQMDDFLDDGTPHINPKKAQKTMSAKKDERHKRDIFTICSLWCKIEPKPSLLKPWDNWRPNC